MGFKNVGTYDLNMVSLGQGRAVAMTDKAISSGKAFLTSELEKRDNLVRTPLTSFTYGRDIPVRVGGGWVDSVSAMSVGYGLAGGSGDNIIANGAADGTPLVTADFSKETFKAHAVTTGTRIFWIDQQRGNITGRSLDTILRDGVRMAYDKHMDENVYTGFARYKTTGLINNPDVVITNASKTFAAANADEILAIINDSIITAWKNAGYDRDAIPNHILLPYDQYNKLITRKVSNDASKSILTYLLENNIAKANGVELFIGATQFNAGAGVGSKDRMAVYVNKEKYIAVDELVPLTRAITSVNADRFSYDTAYAGNVSETQVFYTETILYVDGV